MGFQCLIPLATCAVPTLTLMSLVVANIDVPQMVLLLVGSATVWALLANPIVALTLYTPYREFLLRRLATLKGRITSVYSSDR